MPTYCFRTDDGQAVELTMPASEMLRRQAAAAGELCRSGRGIRDGEDMIKLDDGRFARRDYPAEAAGFQDTNGAGWPIHSEALGVHPSQVPEVREAYRHHGVPTEVTPTGEVILRNPAHRREVMKLNHVIDRAGYC